MLQLAKIMKSLSPAIKGLITGAVMLITAFTLYYTKQPADSPLQWMAYIIYAAGIVWTLVSYRQSPAFTGKFGDLFGQGFKCFIVVTLVMVCFTGVFSAMHPEFAEEAAQNYKKELIEKKERTPAEIEDIVKKVRKQYTAQLISASIFGYLIIGAIVTAGASAFLTRRNQ